VDQLWGLGEERVLEHEIVPDLIEKVSWESGRRCQLRDCPDLREESRRAPACAAVRHNGEHLRLGARQRLNLLQIA
jgi:hypothetical protein